MIYKVIDLPLFDKKMWVYVEKKTLSAVPILAELYNIPIDTEDIIDLKGLVYPLNHKGILVLLHNFDCSIIAHECLHIMQLLQAIFSVELEGEWPAYYTQYLTKSILDKKGYEQFDE
jgi:hypothetical protein